MLKIGDHFVLQVLGQELFYEVDQILTVLPTQMNALKIDPTRDYITLLTCTPYGVNSHRLLVRGHRVDATQEKRQELLREERTDSGRVESTWEVKYRQGIWIGCAIAAVTGTIFTIVFLIRRRCGRK